MKCLYSTALCALLQPLLSDEVEGKVVPTQRKHKKRKKYYQIKLLNLDVKASPIVDSQHGYLSLKLKDRNIDFFIDPPIPIISSGFLQQLTSN